ncbi:MAG: hypothetical protein ACE15C_01905 [Phycisphaerae bacterium]
MAEYKYDQLKVMTVAQLRDIAKGIQNDALEGYTTMHKDHLLPILCKVLGIPTHHIAHGAEKTRIKGEIRKLKAARDEATKAGKADQLAAIRHNIHVLKRKLRVMAETSV